MRLSSVFDDGEYHFVRTPFYYYAFKCYYRVKIPAYVHFN
jgi:hypothetical protein